MELIPTLLKGCVEVRPFFAKDDRGVFVKTFNADCFAEHGLPVEWKEEFYSTSHKGVIRGMHLQTPPYDHEKLVYCMQGRVLDVVLDVRKSSSTFGRYIALELNGARGTGLMIAKGMAHGFLALTDNVLMAYKVTTVYAPASDVGIRWDSFGFDWGVKQPILSERDRSHVMFRDFISPF